METKYTRDNRKVEVLYSLNENQNVVREIHVNEDGDEVSVGERFVVNKSELKDTCLPTWKQTELTRKIESLERSYETTIRAKQNLYKKESDIVKSLTERVSFLSKYETFFNEDDFSTLINFITGKIKYVIKYPYYNVYNLQIITIEELKDSFGGIKLMSMFGGKDGSISYRLNQYSDGSGRLDDHIIPCADLEDAEAKLKDMFNQNMADGKKMDSSGIKVAKEYGIEIKKELLDEYKEAQRKSYKSMIDGGKKTLERYENELKEIESL